MSLKINILSLLLACIFTSPVFAVEKFLRLQGELLDASTQTPLTNFKVRVVEDEMDSTTYRFEKSAFDLWIQPNHVSKVYFIKEGYKVDHMLIDASFIPAIAYKKKQRIQELSVQLKQSSSNKRNSKPILKAEYVASKNAFEVEDLTVVKKKAIPTNYTAPFPSPADTYKNVKPTSKGLGLTQQFDENKAKGQEGIALVIQGILFADMAYCFFNERTNEANNYLAYLKYANKDVWGSIKDFDSPEYGRIVCRTVNREQSIDTLFALGAHLETSRLIMQDFTSDSKVLIHFKTLKNVLQVYKNDSNAQSFVEQMKTMVPHIEKLEEDYKQKLREKMNFEMKDDAAFQEISKKVNQIYQSLISG